MIAFLFFVIGLIFCSFTTFPPAKKLLYSWIRSGKAARENPPQRISHCDAFGVTGTGELRSIFAVFDEDADGYITRAELRKSLKKMGIWSGEEELDEMLKNVDSNGDGLIDFREFSSLFDSISAKNDDLAEDGDLKRAFDVFDENGDGKITVEELGTVLCSMGFTEGKTIENCEEMIRKVDADGDGMVNFDEFKELMSNGFDSVS